jgi:hypothetical protein
MDQEAETKTIRLTLPEIWMDQFKSAVAGDQSIK